LAFAGVRSVTSGWDGIDLEGVMERLGITRGMALRAVARIVVVALVAACLALALAGPGLAATQGSSTPPSGNTTLLIAGLIGGAIAAVWLLKPTGRRPKPPASGPDVMPTQEPSTPDSEGRDS
jgi:hypothetical protein